MQEGQILEEATMQIFYLYVFIHFGEIYDHFKI
jgi:hypothetical protein